MTVFYGFCNFACWIHYISWITYFMAKMCNYICTSEAFHSITRLKTWEETLQSIMVWRIFKTALMVAITLRFAALAPLALNLQRTIPKRHIFQILIFLLTVSFLYLYAWKVFCFSGNKASVINQQKAIKARYHARYWIYLKECELYMSHNAVMLAMLK